MSSVDSEKGAIISELEENYLLSNPQHSAKAQQFEPLTHFTELQQRDFYLTDDTIESIVQSGLDTFFVAKKANIVNDSSGIFPEGEDNPIEEQLEAFLVANKLEHFVSVDDDGDLSLRDKILGLKLTTNAIEDLLQQTKEKRPYLYNELSQHPSLLGIVKTKSKNKKVPPTKKEQKDSTDSPKTKRGRKGDEFKGFEVSFEDQDATPNIQQSLSLIVAKCIAEGNMQSYLIAISCLMNAFVTSLEKSKGKAGDSHVVDDMSVLLLPVGSLISSLFDFKGAGHAEESEGDQHDSVKSPIPGLSIPNPFQHFVKQKVVRQEMSESSPTCDVSSSQDTVNRDGKYTGDDSSVLPTFVVANSDAASTVSSLLADHGTETASLTDIVEGEEMTEEELLAQALAMSLGENTSATGVQSLCNEISLSPSSLSRLDRQSPVSQLDSYSASGMGEDRSLETIITFGPFADLNPLSTFGPFCDIEYWKFLFSNHPSETLSMPNITSGDSVNSSLFGSLSFSSGSVPVQCIIMALMINLCGSIDVKILQSQEKLPSESSDDASNSPNESTFIRPPPITNIISTSPTSLCFHMVEYLMETCLSLLPRICQDPFNVTYDLSTSQTKEDSSKVDFDLLARNWKFTRYFMVWTTSMLCKVLSYSLRNCECNYIFGPLCVPTIHDKSVSSMLLKHVAEYIGMDVIPMPITGIVDQSLIGIKQDKWKITLEKIEIGVFHSDVAYRHCLRCHGLDAFVSGFSLFFPQATHKSQILLHLFSKSPLNNAVDDSFQLYSSYTYEFCYPGIILTKQAAGQSKSLNTADAFQSWQFNKSIDFYKSVLLQKICLMIVEKLNRSFRDVNSIVEKKPQVKTADPDKLRIMEHLRALLPQGIEPSDHVLERMYNAVVEAREEGTSILPTSESVVKNSFEIEKDSQALLVHYDDYLDVISHHSVENQLFQRLNTPELMVNFAKSNYSDTSARNCLFYGEFNLYFLLALRQLRKSVSDEFECPFYFCRHFGTPHLRLEDGDTSISIPTDINQTWSVAIADVAYKKYSGTHVWTFSVETSSLSSVCVGVTTVNCTNCIGFDENSWGVLLNGQSYHNNQYVDINGFNLKEDSISVITLRLDTSLGILSLSTNQKDFIDVHRILSDLPLFPAVSLSTGVKKLSVQPTQLESSLHYNSDALNIFIHVCQGLLNSVDSIIKFADKMDDATRKRSVIMHPFITVIFPSVTAFLITERTSFQQYTVKLSLHLLPLLGVITKRLAAFNESQHRDATDTSDDFGIIGDLSGKWLIKSSASGSAVAAQEYLLTFKCVNEQSENNNNDMTVQSTLISGYGCGSSSTVRIKGTVVGTRLKFLESWQVGGNCNIDARISLNGEYFSGTYKDAKSDTSGSLQGFRKSYCRKVWDGKLLMRAALLSSNLCGVLIGFLLSDNEDFLNQFLKYSDSKTSDDETKNEISQLLLKESSKDEESKLEEEEEEDSSKKVENKVGVIAKWQISSVLSNGLRLTDLILQLHMSQLKNLLYLPQYEFHNQVISTRNCEVVQSFDKSWNEDLFRNVINSTDAGKDFNAEFYKCPVLDEIPFSLCSHCNTFCSGLLNDSNEAKSVDTHISMYLGVNNVTKLAEDNLKIARKHIISVLLYHTSYYKICEINFESSLQSLENNGIEKPNSLLLEVWKTAQRIIENYMRKKQLNGMTYAEIHDDILLKSKFLHLVQVNDVCAEMTRGLTKVLSKSESKFSGELSFNSEGLSSESVQTECSKIMLEIIDFFLLPVGSVHRVFYELFRSSLKGLLRSAGLKVFLLIIGRASSTVSNVEIKPNSLSNLFILSSLIESIIPPLYSCIPVKKGSHQKYVVKTSVNDDHPTKGHFTWNLLCCSKEFVSDLRKSFEGAYEIITQTLQRSTWASCTDGQCVALCSWEITVTPAEHSFLNRIGLFRILQTVLDDVRGRNNSKTDVNSANKRLTKLILRIVHSLASQVALSKESFGIHSLHLQRVQSGPETLSQALFDMLYIELFSCLKQPIVQQVPTPAEDKLTLLFSSFVSSINGSSKEPDDLEDLEGAKYAYRILRLLFSVSGSSVCQRNLLSPKWLTLLFAVITYGHLGIHRQIMKLLRKLLTTASPKSLKMYVESLYHKNTDFMSFEKPLEDDDVLMLMEESDIDNSALNLVKYLLECSMINVPLEMSTLTDISSKMLTSLLSIAGATEAIAAESISLVRILFDCPAWSDIVKEAIQISHFSVSSLVLSTNNDDARKIIVACQVFGGYIDKLRIGGVVTLKPFSLVGMSESFALRLAAISHSCGLLVSKSNSSNSIEVVLLERSRKAAAEKKTEIQLALAGPPPIRTVKISSDDVFPASEIPPSPDLIDKGALSVLCNLLSVALKAVNSTLKSNGEEEKSDDQDNESKGEEPNDSSINDSFGLFTAITIIRSFSMVLQSDDNISQVMLSSEIFQDLFQSSAVSSSIASLGELEVLEERWSSLWEVICRNQMSKALGMPVEAPLPENKKSRSSKANALEQSIAQLAREPGSASASMLAAILGGPSQAEANRAKEQMMEMGFPREWCEVALRRCRYNVEMAINLCFEHGAEMDQLVAEEAALQSAVSSSRSQRGDSGRGLTSRLGLRSESSSRSRSKKSSDDVGSKKQQLLDMGFPASWCTKALEACNGDVDGALSWILSHGDELVDDESNDDNSSPKETDVGPNPLSIVSGTATIKEDLTCTLGTGGFPSVGCRGYSVSSGKWYFEVNLLSNGCMQIGWVDNSYEGKADAGEGVGDDSMSWAFDGWRKYLWHETASEWGARWNVGDVVGCYLDMDNLKMEFYLNGFGEEIGMGVAFENFKFMGGLYPCASYNKSEKLQFNFGHKKFKYGPRPGYKPFIDNVYKITKINLRYLKDCSETNESYLKESDSAEVSSPSLLLEDSLEEERGENEFLSHKRYFASDETRSSLQERLSPMPAASFYSNSPLPTTFEGALKEFRKTSYELSLSFTKIIVLRIFAALHRLEDPRVVGIILNSNLASKCPDILIRLLKESSMYTQRTKVYLLTMSILSSNSLPPPSLGSILQTGGAPMLLSVSKSMTYLLDQASKTQNYFFIQRFLRQIRVENINATRREFSADWKFENGLAPVIIKDLGHNVPSLHLSVWLSQIIFVQLSNELLDAFWIDAEASMRHMKILIEAWGFALRSPSIAVKFCSSKMLSNMIQDLFFHDTKHFKDVDQIVTILKECISLERLERLCLKRIGHERGSQPICSKYQQSLLELAVALRSVFSGFGDIDPIVHSNQLADYPQSIAETDNKVCDFNWDAICGSLLSDDGWEIWSGSVTQLSTSFTSAQAIPSRSNQDGPPELMPGCKVAKSKASRMSADDIDIQDERKITSPLLSPKVSTPKAGDAKSETQENKDLLIGTVVDICEWEDCGAGTGRVVKWENGKVETVRWGANDYYDVCHIYIDKDNKVVNHPYPVSKEKLAAKAGFASEFTFGIILRLRSQPKHNSDSNEIAGRFDGIMEWPDFRAIVYVTGVMYLDGHWGITEEKLIGGSSHSDWTIRFGKASWQRGTSYNLRLSTDTSYDDASGPTGKYLVGNFSYDVDAFVGTMISINGEIKIQQSKLFTFDPICHSSSISISHDKLAAACTGAEGKSIAFASVGFSSGVHYWELRIEQCDISNIFVGVAEKAKLGTLQQLNRWQGYGFVNLRTSYRHNATGTAEKVYGDVFHAGDVVGVMLDMNRGRLSFFLDGIKYGEHSLTDLGEAFDSLCNDNSYKVLPKTYYPVIGFRRTGDRVAITPRWISHLGDHTPYNEFKMFSRAWSLLLTWSCHRPTKTPLSKDMWTYREAWRDWLRWKNYKHLRVRTRCKAPNLMVNLDTSPRACVDASIRIGLKTAMFHGDRFVWVKACGRKLETKEDAVILGAFRGMLWYRHDNQIGNTGTLVESSAPAWCLATHDVEDIQLVSRGIIGSLLPPEIINIKLPRLPMFHGGRVKVIYEGGAVMRDGLEIDCSEVIQSVDTNACVYAVERRVNSSNIARYKVFYKGQFGWISERIRGGNEEYMATRIHDESLDAIEQSKAEIKAELRNAGLDDDIEFDNVSSPPEAILHWMNSVIQSGGQSFFDVGGILGENNSSGVGESMEDFVELASSFDGSSQWPVEWDMQLAEFVSKVSGRVGQSPFNVTYDQIKSSFNNLDHLSPLAKIDVNRLLARVSIIRIANLMIGYGLPFMDTILHEERWTHDCFGSSANDVEVDATSTPSTLNLLSLYKESAGLGENYNQIFAVKDSWQPVCGARRLRAMRRVLFAQTKRMFWENILDATTTPTPLHQDEYEDPREIKVIKINRVKATTSKLATILNTTERLRQSVFGQMHREMRNWPASAFRRSYVGKGHGGQKRAFKVKFMGEGVNDYGGPYRAVFDQIVEELQCDQIVAARKANERCLFPLLIPCPNRFHSVGLNQDKFVISSSPTSPLSQELMQLFGRLSGTALRHNLTMSLDLPSLVWRPLVRLPINQTHLGTVDTLTVEHLKSIERLGLQYESEGMSHNPPEWEDINFTTTLSDGTKVALIPNGEETKVTLQNWREYIALCEKYRLRESSIMYRAFRDGLSSVVPVELLSLFTPLELEQLICGSRSLDISLLKQCTEYEMAPNEEVIKYLWEVLEEFSDDDKTAFLRFVWARSRMPAATHDLPMFFKIQNISGDAATSPDNYLPHAQTCFFSLQLPKYSSKDILREKLLYAINNSPNMDADVRLHNAEGWSEL